MAGQSGSPRFNTRFESALRAYQKTTGVTLAEHSVVARLQNCDSVEAITTLLLYEARVFSDSPGFDRIAIAIKSTISNLSTLSATASLGDATGLPFSPPRAIQAGLAILLAAVNGKPSNYDRLVELLQSIEHFLNRLDIYASIPPTPATDEMIFDTMMELLSTLALATKELKQRRPIDLVKKFLGNKDIQAVLQKLDRLTQDQARIATTQTLAVVHHDVYSMNEVMDESRVSMDGARETSETLHQHVGDVNKPKRDKLREDIFRWLSPPDPWKNYNVSRESRHSETGEWFVNGNTFSEWKGSGSSSLLWIHGKPGAGKSVLCSSIIEEIETMCRSGLASLAMFYYDFREDKKKDLRGLLSSVLFQLCDQSNSYYDILSNFYSAHRNGAQSPSDDDLVRCLKNLLGLPGPAAVYLIVDALDECPDTSALSSPRRKLLMLLEDLIDSQLPNLHICVTSRLEADIKSVLQPLTFRTVSLHDESGQREDLENYIKSVVNTNRDMRRWKPEHKELVIGTLIKNADGMFRWAYCQLDYLGKCLPGRILHALNELPETLDETYERTLREINERNWEFARHLLLCVAVVARPLQVEELADILAFDFNARSIPKFHEDWRLEDPIEAVLSTCSSLLSVVVDVDVDDSPVIQFSHFSVKEFLMSARFAEKRDLLSHRFHISMIPAHTLVTQACLGILLHLDEDISKDDLRKFALAKYAAEYWFEHARFESVSQKADEGMKLLFDQRKPHFSVWLRIYDPEVLYWEPNESPERSLEPRGTPLHYAALCGLNNVVEVLVIENSQDLNCHSFWRKNTPLHLASANGHAQVTRILIEHNADVSAHDRWGRTPLHDASGKGHAEIARLLVEYGADLSAQDIKGRTPLHEASARNFVGVAQLLVERGADAAVQDKDGWTPLHRASYGGHVEIAQLLLEHGARTALEAKTNPGYTPLYEASRHKDRVKLVYLLIKYGADVTAKQKTGKTPLHRASYMGNVVLARLLVDHGANVAGQDKSGRTPLHAASLEGHVELVRFLVEHGADVATQDKNGRTPLHEASAGGCVESARLLLERGADVTGQDKNRKTPLHEALFRGDVQLARLMVKHGTDIAAQNENRSTPLYWTSDGGNVGLPRHLIEHGTDAAAHDQHGSIRLYRVSIWGVESSRFRFIVNHDVGAATQDKQGSTLLYQALDWGDIEFARCLVECGAYGVTQDKDRSTLLHRTSEQGRLELAQLLVKHGADGTAQDNNGSTPLHWVSARGDVKLARLLIKYGADAAAHDKNGSTPLHQVSFRGDLELARLLVKHGADAAAQDKHESTPLHRASFGGNLDVARLLVKHGANAIARDNHGSTPLHQVSFGGHVELARFLVKHVANTAAQDKHGSTPLHRASFGGHVELARLLVEHGADVVAQDKDGSTPLHRASDRGHVELARFLIEQGANVAAQDKHGSTPLHRASLGGHIKLAQLLIEHGADVVMQNKDGLTPLHQALDRSHIELAWFLIEHHANATAEVIPQVQQSTTN